jgi:hypothetical protein
MPSMALICKAKRACVSDLESSEVEENLGPIEGIKQHPDYQNLKISYGKDRCGGAPRAFRGFDTHASVTWKVAKWRRTWGRR